MVTLYELHLKTWFKYFVGNFFSHSFGKYLNFLLSSQEELIIVAFNCKLI